MVPVEQKVQPMLQPTWELTHRVARRWPCALGAPGWPVVVVVAERELLQLLLVLQGCSWSGSVAGAEL